MLCDVYDVYMMSCVTEAVQPFQTGFCRWPWSPVSGCCCEPSTAARWHPHRSLRQQAPWLLRPKCECLFRIILTWRCAYYYITTDILWLPVFHPRNYSLQNVWTPYVFALSQVSRLYSCASESPLCGRGLAQTAGITRVIVQAGTPQITPSHWSAEGVLQTVVPRSVSDNTVLITHTVYSARTHMHARINLPRPFMALCRTSASALALKFPLAFTVPLLACNTEDVHTQGYFFLCSEIPISHCASFMSNISIYEEQEQQYIILPRNKTIHNQFKTNTYTSFIM